MNVVSKIIEQLEPFLPYIIGLIVVLSVSILIYLLFKSRKQKDVESGNETDVTASSKPQKSSVLLQLPVALRIKKTFREGLKALKKAVPGRNYRYKIPWFLMMGEPGAGKTTLLKEGGMELPLGIPEEIPGENKGCNWWFFNQGVVLDVDGDYFQNSNGRISDEKGWVTFLEALLDSRPQRSIDGVVLTLPAKDLMDPKISEAERFDRVGKKAAGYYDKLMVAQKILGMRFPVYVLVTQCDQVRGFKSFSNELPESYQSDIFGWSNPYTLESGYASHWVDEAFQSINKDLYETQTEVLVNEITPKDQDGIFLFPNEMLRLKEPLRVTMDHLFRKSVYKESFYFRGIYFCGAAGSDEKENSAIQEVLAADHKPKYISNEETSELPPENTSKVFFIKDLFEKKVFLESRLARPTIQIFQRRGKMAWVARAAVILVFVVWGLGLSNAYSGLNNDRTVLKDIFESIKDNLAHLKELENKHLTMHKENFKQDTDNLLKGMTRISSGKFDSAFIPSSWFSPLNDDIESMMALAYEKIIFKSLLLGLNEKAKKITTAESNQKILVTPDSYTHGELVSNAEFALLRNTVVSLDQLSHNAVFFNGLKDSKDLAQLGDVVEYVHGIKLDSEFYENASSYHNALGEAGKSEGNETFEFSDYKNAAITLVNKQSKILFKKINEKNRLVARLESYSKFIRQFQARKTMSEIDESQRFLNMLLLKTEDLESTLNEPEFSWIKENKLDFGPAFNDLLNTIEVNPFLGTEVRQEIEQRGEKGLAKLKRKLLAYQTDLTGPIIFRKNKSISMRLSEPTVKLKEVLIKYVDHRVLTPIDQQTELVEELPLRSKVMWDKTLLNKAINFHKDYVQFTQNNFQKFPTQLKPMVSQAFKANLKSNMLEQIALAQQVKVVREEFVSLRPEDDLALELRNFKDSARLLGKLMDIFYDLEFVDSSNILFKLVSSQAYNLLETLEHLLINENLYRFRENNFSWWNGFTPVSLDAFDVKDKKDLEYYLSLQRQRIKQLAEEYARPVLAFLVDRTIKRSEEQEKLVSKWHRILLELDKYQAKNTKNTLSRLQNFILFEMKQVKPGSCLEKFSKENQRATAKDYFSEKLFHLRQQLITRCKVLVEDDVSNAYRVIETFFNENLAGKFPFSKLTNEQIVGEAEPEDIREFFNLFDNYKKNKLILLEKNQQFDVSKEHVLEFIEEIENVQKFLKPFSKPVKLGQAVYFIQPEFRVNRKYESLGQEIIDWKIETDKETFTNQQKDKKLLSWGWGEPLRISFRWAKNAPHYPVHAGDWGGVEIGDRSVVYEFKNLWSLFHLLARQSSDPEDFDRLEDPSPHTLKFLIQAGEWNTSLKIPEQWDEVAAREKWEEEKDYFGWDQKQADQEWRERVEKGQQKVYLPKLVEAKLFVRVVPKTLKKKQAIELPTFPIHAPQLNLGFNS